ncbi:MAG: divalent-cation tolerance protein CutA [Spirochaetes bacterium]|nr:divalent-cation tolerance protein CutA [Spirochaetota bacterium]
MEYCVIFCTVPSDQVGLEIANTLVSNKLAACVNIIPGLTSIYTWKGEICNDRELLCVIKTKKDLYKEVEEAIKKIHPYEVAEIIALPVTRGSSDYLQWIESVTK